MKNKKILVVGGVGFVGSYLIPALREEGAEVFTTNVVDTDGKKVFYLDLLDRESIKKTLAETMPDYVFHLAAQSSVGLSWQKIALTLDVNIKGTANLLDEVRALEKKPRVFFIGSGEEYGYLRPEEIPVKEDTYLRPGNPYAMTKAAGNMLASIYAKAYAMDIIMVRPFNHIGPNQIPGFVVADFCKQVAEIERGEIPPVIHVGNLASKRDFTDVRDVVRAYILLAKMGETGQTYNVGSGKAISIQRLLDEILALSTTKIEVKVDESRLRPIDVPVIEADITKLHTLTGWKPEVPLSETLLGTLNHWREKTA